MHCRCNVQRWRTPAWFCRFGLDCAFALRIWTMRIFVRQSKVNLESLAVVGELGGSLVLFSLARQLRIRFVSSMPFLQPPVLPAFSEWTSGAERDSNDSCAKAPRRTRRGDLAYESSGFHSMQHHHLFQNLLGWHMRQTVMVATGLLPVERHPHHLRRAAF